VSESGVFLKAEVHRHSAASVTPILVRQVT
jgi:hypothetical protein